MKKLTVAEKTVIVALNSEKWSTRAIAAKIERSQSALTKFLRKYRTTRSVERKEGSGRKRKTSQREDHLIKRISLRDRFKTAVDIRTEFGESSGTQISVETVRRRLRKQNLNARTPATKPLLTGKMRS